MRDRCKQSIIGKGSMLLSKNRCSLIVTKQIGRELPSIRSDAQQGCCRKRVLPREVLRVVAKTDFLRLPVYLLEGAIGYAEVSLTEIEAESEDVISAFGVIEFKEFVLVMSRVVKILLRDAVQIPICRCSRRAEKESQFANVSACGSANVSRIKAAAVHCQCSC